MTQPTQKNTKQDRENVSHQFGLCISTYVYLLTSNTYFQLIQEDWTAFSIQTEKYNQALFCSATRLLRRQSHVHVQYSSSQPARPKPLRD